MFEFAILPEPSPQLLEGCVAGVPHIRWWHMRYFHLRRIMYVHPVLTEASDPQRDVLLAGLVWGWYVLWTERNGRSSKDYPQLN